MITCAGENEGTGFPAPQTPPKMFLSETSQYLLQSLQAPTAYLMKDFDTFSFRARSIKRLEDFDNKETLKSAAQTVNAKNWRDMTYRFEKNGASLSKPAVSRPVYETHFINDKISRIDEELTQNIRRRIELQNKLYKERIEQRQVENQKMFKENNVRSETQQAEIYTKMEQKSTQIDAFLARTSPLDGSRTYIDHIQNIKAKKDDRILSKKSIQKKAVAPDQIRLQRMLRQASFPEIPKANLQKMWLQFEEFLVGAQNSDVAYLAMVLSFHMQHYHRVRHYFREIQMYKVFEAKAYWVACQTEYELQNYDLCLKLANICMGKISDVHLPRLTFLQARSYEKLGNFINSVVCYNQAIKMKPHVAELYLQRAMIYDKIGYPKQAQQDYAQFGALEPEAKQILKEKILTEKNQTKRKQMIKALARIA